MTAYMFLTVKGVSQAYVDAVLDLASHFITRLRRYASFCRTLASHAVNAGPGSNRNMVTSPNHTSASPTTSQGTCTPLSNEFAAFQELTMVKLGIF